MTTAVCRGCGRPLKGKPYGLGRGAWIPETGERAKINFFGGYVCCRSCDVSVSLRMQSSFPGAGIAKRLDSPNQDSVDINWPD